MKETKLSVMMHPVRMRIIQVLLVEKRQTVQQINSRLPEIPQATLYRHLSTLLKEDIIKVVEVNPIRGTLEKVYSLTNDIADIASEDIENANSEEHFKYFFTFLINLLGDFENYLNKNDYDLSKDGVMYKQASIYLTDTEFAEVIEVIGGVLSKHIHNKPGKQRKLKTIATIVLPKIKSQKI